MTQFQPEERARLKRLRTTQAISLATQGRWEEAVTANRQIIEFFPKDVDAFNRLGKALTELGRYAEAREAYSRALANDPNNTIAKKNVTRLVALSRAPVAPVQQGERVDPRLFIEETGKTGFAALQHVGPREVLAKLTAGDQVYLKVEGRVLKVENGSGEYLGQIEPKLALRLIHFLKAGNKYAAAVTSLDDHQVKLIIKETYQDPSQAGKVSFPTKEGETFRAYTRESLLRYELEEEEEAAEEGEYAEWEGEHEPVAEEVELVEEESSSSEKPANHDEFESW